MFKWETSNEKKIMSRLFADVAKYCKKCQFSNEKISSLMGIYYYTHSYNKFLDIQSYSEIFNFFEELIIHHSVLVRRFNILSNNIKFYYFKTL